MSCDYTSFAIFVASTELSAMFPKIVFAAILADVTASSATSLCCNCSASSLFGL